MSLRDFILTQSLSENQIKYEALENMKNIQAALGSISFIDVIAVMKETNPLKKEVFEMEDMLHQLTVTVSEFINNNLPDAVPETDDEQEAKVDKAVKDAEVEKEIADKTGKEEE